MAASTSDIQQNVNNAEGMDVGSPSGATTNHSEGPVNYSEISSESNRELLQNVIREALEEEEDDSIDLDDYADENDDFWDPIIEENRKGRAHAQENVADNGNTNIQGRKYRDESCENQCEEDELLENDDSFDFNDAGFHYIRRSRSAEILPSRSPCYRCPTDINQDDVGGSKQSVISDSCSSDYDSLFANPDGVTPLSFFEEYDKRIDQLEYTDYTLEEAFAHIQSKIDAFEEMVCPLENKSTDTPDEVTVHDQATNTDGDMPIERADEPKVLIKESSVDRVEEDTCTESATNEDNEKRKLDWGSVKIFMKGLQGAMVEMKSRFETFVEEVGGEVAYYYSKQSNEYMSLSNNSLVISGLCRLIFSI